jgi:hypothetical protein
MAATRTPEQHEATGYTLRFTSSDHASYMVAEHPDFAPQSYYLFASKPADVRHVYERTYTDGGQTFRTGLFWRNGEAWRAAWPQD